MKNFKEFIVSEGMQENNICERMLFMVVQARMWHFLTKSYSKHEAFDEFYEKLGKHVDSVIEASIPNFGDIQPTATRYSFAKVDNAVNDIKIFKMDVISWYNSKEESPGVASLIENVLADCDSVIYKLENLD